MDEFEAKKRIYNIVSNNPGIYASKIAEILKIRLSEVESHLQYFVRRGQVIVKKDAGYDQYFPKEEKEGSRDKNTQEIRRNIYNIIKNTPGLHMTKIAELVNMKVSLAVYHLTYMEKNDEIVAVKEGGYFKRYYIKDSEVGTSDRKILSLLRQKTLLRIISLLMKHPVLRHRELLDNFDMAPSTLSYHLEKLLKSDILEVQTFGEEKGYKLRNKRKILLLLLKYESDVQADEFKDAWDDLTY